MRTPPLPRRPFPATAGTRTAIRAATLVRAEPAKRPRDLPSTASSAPKKFAHFSRKRSLCAAQRALSKPFVQPPYRTGRRPSAAPRRPCATIDVACESAHLFFKTRLFYALSFRCSATGANMRQAFARPRCIPGGACVDDAAGCVAKNSWRGVLTVEKTVIRFRPTDVAAEASESAHSENAQQKKHLRPELLQGG